MLVITRHARGMVAVNGKGVVLKAAGGDEAGLARVFGAMTGRTAVRSYAANANTSIFKLEKTCSIK